MFCLVKIDLTNLLNQGVLEYLRRGKGAEIPPIAAPGSVADPYMGQGSHPDIVQRVWDELGANLPKKCKCLIYGTPALVHERSGIVIAICNGTQYNLRLTDEDFQRAISMNAKTVNRWSTGDEMDSLKVLGANWIFGGWFKEELVWCRNTYSHL